MKKTHIIILISVLSLFGGTSCNKTWMCECKTRGVTVEVKPIKNLGKWGAKSVCDTYQEQNNLNGGDQVCFLR